MAYADDDELWLNILDESIGQTFDSDQEALDAYFDIGPSDTWESVDFQINHDGEFFLNIDGHEFYLGPDEQLFLDVYEYMQDHEIDFDVHYEG